MWFPRGTVVRLIKLPPTMDQRMNVRVCLMLFCLGGLIVGGFLVINPFFHLSDPVPQDGWLGALYSMAASILLGITLILGSSIGAIGLGIAFAISPRTPQVVNKDATPNAENESESEQS